MTKPLRPISMIEAELADARLAAEESKSISRRNPLVALMLDGNDRDIEELSAELAAARSSDLEVSIEGSPVTDHRISVPYMNRVTSGLQSAYRSIARSLEPDRKLTNAQGTLHLASTAPGSFRMRFRTSEEPLSLLERPLSERALGQLFEVLESSRGRDAEVFAVDWASRSPDASIRAMVRLASALAASHGTTQLRWTSLDGTDRSIQIEPDQARRLAAALAGKTGRELLTVRGHLRMAQDDPPKVKITSAVDEYIALVHDEELLYAVKDLLFGDVIAEIAVDMSTSRTTGAPMPRTELLDIRADDGET